MSLCVSVCVCVCLCVCVCVCVGQAEAELKDFSPYYRKQFCVARLSQVEDELEQQKASTTQLLRQRVRLRVQILDQQHLR